MDGQITVRPCSEADVKGVLALWARAAAPHSKPDTLDGVRLRLHRDRELFLLALDGDSIVGSLMAGWDGWRGNLYRMAVAPEHRRRGVASTLLAEAERALAAAGCTRIHAAVVRESDGAVPFWEAVGYAPSPTTVDYAKDIGTATAPAGTGAFRLAVESDAEEVAAQVVQLVTELGGVPPEQSAARIAARRLIEDSSLGFVAVAASDDTLAGVCTVTFEHAVRTGGRHATIQEAYVVPERRNSGVGGQLVQFAMDEAAKRGCEVVELSTPVADGDQVRFYERLGFHVVGRRLRWRA